MTPPDTVSKAELAEAFAKIATRLPEGLQVHIYRPAGESRVAVETTYPDGEVCRHWADQGAN